MKTYKNQVIAQINPAPSGKGFIGMLISNPNESNQYTAFSIKRPELEQVKEQLNKKAFCDSLDIIVWWGI